MSSTDTTLECGTHVRDLNALLDYREGAHDALAPQRASELSSHVSDCALCQQTLASLSALHVNARTLLDEEATAAAQGPWLDQLIHNLMLEARPGRSIPLAAPTAERVLDQTEGSLRALVRNEVGDDDTIVVGTRLNGDITTYRARVDLDMTLHVRLGAPIPDTVARARKAATSAIMRATPLDVHSVDVTVADTYGDITGVEA
ncbi:hypothetical protein H8R18_06910 [Nanchangia anserum]|uniref:Asp23/Gls24 family envelope stress response protein n=1 Tax=Nanchangia anserum TaxID=2692125 RepID=A0A8I0GBS5_9ACTO|nr:hypothetical protein [Nanchangia anserum]MBD3689260.1 hypothetical protein [Nanchangia anserum]QOX81481.1 hypothetical protein H8R18_06910 [Nanchangia anserum]